MRWTQREGCRATISHSSYIVVKYQKASRSCADVSAAKVSSNSSPATRTLSDTATRGAMAAETPSARGPLGRAVKLPCRGVVGTDSIWYECEPSRENYAYSLLSSFYRPESQVRRVTHSQYAFLAVACGSPQRHKALVGLYVCVDHHGAFKPR